MYVPLSKGLIACITHAIFKVSMEDKGVTGWR